MLSSQRGREDGYLGIARWPPGSQRRGATVVLRPLLWSVAGADSRWPIMAAPYPARDSQRRLFARC